MLKNKNVVFYLRWGLFAFILLNACKGPVSLFKGKYAHQQYQESLKNAGLGNSVLYHTWVNEAINSIENPQLISIPYQEEGYFKADRPSAVAFVFEAKQGERLEISIVTANLDSAQVFLDLFQVIAEGGQKPKHILSADTNAYHLSYEIDNSGNYLLRIQPELLTTVSYKLKITAEASLAFPIANLPKVHIGSFYGVDRDAGKRKHEGLDIFAPRRTPTLAVAEGEVTKVGVNNLGGNVVWMRPRGRAYHLYYAHLDTQLVQQGEMVKIGDTLGLVGNTGNALRTPPHLHFGIYGASGAVDPLPFLRPGKSNLPRIASTATLIGDTLRVQKPKNYIQVGSRAGKLEENELAIIEAAMQNNYRVLLPDKSKVIISQQALSSLSKSLKKIKSEENLVIYQQPDVRSASIGKLSKGTSVQVLASYQDFYFVRGEISGWIPK